MSVDKELFARRVILETPYAAPDQVGIEANLAYARACLKHCLDKGEAPFASHLLYTQTGVLDDTNPEQRAAGIEAGLSWGALAHATVVYVDRGISQGMQLGIDTAKRQGRLVIFRSLNTDAEQSLPVVKGGGA